MNAYIFSLLSALWLVDDSTAVVLRYVLTRDKMMSFLNSQLVRLLMVDTCALMDIRTSQVMIRSRTSSHFAVHIHVSPIPTQSIVENPRKWCPVFRLVAEPPGY